MEESKRRSRMPFNRESMYDISESQLRWQIYTSLAIGAKGVMYFCYWTPDGNDFLRGQAIMTPDCSGVKAGEKCDISNQVSAVAASVNDIYKLNDHLFICIIINK